MNGILRYFSFVFALIITGISAKSAVQDSEIKRLPQYD